MTKTQKNSELTVVWVDANTIKTDFPNYAKRDIVKSKEELDKLRASIVANGIEEPIQLDKNNQVFSGYTRTNICQEHSADTGKPFMVPVLIYKTIDLSSMKEHEIKLEQCRRNTRVKVPAQALIELCRLCDKEGMEVSEISDQTGLSPKEVAINLGIIESKITEDLFKKKVSKNSIVHYCKSVKNNEELENDPAFIKLFVDYSGSELKGQVNHFKTLKRLTEMKKDKKQRFSPKPTLNAGYVNDNSKENLALATGLLDQVGSIKDEDIREAVIGICQNMQTIYSMDELTLQERKLDFKTQQDSIDEEREKVVKKSLSFEKRAIDKKAKEAAKKASEKVLKAKANTDKK